MDAVLKKSLDAIEVSLASLIDSVANDDPSADAAAALVAADDDLSSSLEQLVIHQTNHQRLLHLRALSSALDSELSTLLTTLSHARTELQSAPTTVFPANARPVEYDALLSYATKISKFTRPPTHLRSQPAPPPPTGTYDAAATQTTGDAAAAGSSTQQAGSSTALVLKSDINGNNNNINTATSGGANPPNTTTAEPTTGNAATRPTAEDIAMLDPTAGMPFVPWPTEEIMKRGILANMGSLEAMADAAANAAPPEAAQNADNTAAVAAATTAQTAAPAGGERQVMSEADKERAREEAARREAERRQKEQEVFQTLDLYVSDSD
ncbi:hypothetical protein TWF730_004583 [Orbilia blumenaviensis]|uniref:Mediator of RNA polymerase II transcription subunit 4 n=1 Tax=Orbilia blumenaviensis TaxID=1796055 RepID=A0AAV9U167_9PEZI